MYDSTNDKPLSRQRQLATALALALGLGAAGTLALSARNTASPAAASRSTEGSAAPAVSQDAGQTAVERGRYIIRTSGCNDCHTPGFMQRGEGVPEALWLTGVPVGWRGPWGTTYAPNLRLSLKDMTLEDWITIARSRNDRPPMPWPSLHAMTDEDLTAVYRYIRSLPLTGERMPDGLTPDQEPLTLFISLMPQTSSGAPTQP